mgnify:CR=1 FL=1
MWRVVDVAADGRHLSLERGHVLVRQDGAELGRVPIGDVQAVLIHGHGCTVSVNLTAALADAGVPLVLCGRNHTPVAISLPVTGNYEQATRMHDQADAALPLRKRLWRDVVKAKISAQSQALALVGHADAAALAKYIGIVKPGDPDNVEAQAARYYWQRLLGSDFRRDAEGGGLNGPLNYGYTILRSAVSRTIVAAGLNPSLGLHHRGRLNPFQLADDLMEPFRPLVDARVAANRSDWVDGLTADGKRYLADLANAPLQTPDGVTALSTVLGRVCLSLVAAYGRNSRTLWLPDVLTEHRQGELSLDNGD